MEPAAAVSTRGTRWRTALSHVGSIVVFAVTSACASPDRTTGPTNGPYIATRPEAEHVWPTAVHRVAADGISPEQAIDAAIARIKQILAE